MSLPVTLNWHTLSNRERAICLLYKGELENHKLNIKELSLVFNVSPQKIRKILTNALNKLYHNREDENIPYTHALESCP